MSEDPQVNNDTVEPDADRFPYGVKITIFLNGEIQFDVKDKIYQLGENLTVKFVENQNAEAQYTERTFPGFQVWDVMFSGFRSACDAERAGLKLAESILWLSVSRNFPVRLISNRSLACTVYDRTRGPSFEDSAYAHQTRKEKIETIIEGMKEAFFSEHEVTVDRERLLLAMEIFSSSQLEVTQRARFISLVTSLEALCDQQDYKEYTERVKEKIDELINAIKSEISIPENVRNSLVGKIQRDMNIESVRQAISRVVMQLLNDEQYKKLFEEAYKVRSELVHDGKSDADLHNLSESISKMIRRTFAACLHLSLYRD